MEDTVVNFLNGTDLNKITFQPLTWQEQELLIQKTLKHPIIQKYPMKQSYVKAFLKRLISDLEAQGADVHDIIYTHLCSLMAEEVGMQEFVFRHFCVTGSETFFDILTLKESIQLISNGTTGLRSWEAASVLSEWCWQEQKHISEQSILELGSGAGLTGIFIMKFCNPKNLILSDCHDKVLNLLTENVGLNFEELKTVDNTAEIELFRAHREDANVISIINLPWEDTHRNSQYFRVNIPDYIIGADIVYDPDLYKELCDAINCIISLNVNCKVILVNTMRNKENYDRFLECLHCHDLMYAVLPVPQSNKLRWNKAKEFQIISISCISNKSIF